MARKHLPWPTEGELEILRVLWEQGPCTAMQITADIRQRRTVGNTSVLKLLQIMYRHKMVTRTKRGRAHVYEAQVKKGPAQQGFMRNLVNRVFGGSRAAMIDVVFADRKVPPEEVQEAQKVLRRLLREKQ